MKSIGARLTVWYALAMIVTFGSLLLVGRFLLEKDLVDGIDLLIQTEFKRIEAVLGPDYESLTPEDINSRIRQTTEISSVLFYIQVHRRGPLVVFKSSNLRGQELPDVKGQHIFNAEVPGIGELRVQEFIMGSLEVQVATSLAQMRNVIEGYTETGLVLMAVAIVTSCAIGFGLSRVALRPIRIIQETANHIRSDNLSERIPVSDVQDEVSNLARLLNQMFDRLESSFNQIRRFTAEASHELKTPLSLVRLQAEKLIIEGNLTPSQEESVQSQLEEIARLNKIIEELLFLSRAEARAITLEARAQNPKRFVESFEQDARVLAEHRGQRFAQTHRGEGFVSFDPKWIRQVLLNLLTNALNVSPQGGRTTLVSEIEPECWRVSIEDEGPGVPSDQLERIFERFVRLSQEEDKEDKGSGLGLAICRSVIGLHKGRIFAESAGPGRGLRVIFEIPLADPSDVSVDLPAEIKDKSAQFSEISA